MQDDYDISDDTAQGQAGKPAAHMSNTFCAHRRAEKAPAINGCISCTQLM